MFYKIFVIFAVIAVINAVPVAVLKEAEADAPAEYEFSYSVRDDATGDIKNQEESRKGDDVKGSYSLIDADGFQRIVEYTADAENGFNAVVRREEIKGFEPPKAIVAAPVAKIAKVAYVAPKIAYTAPVFHKVVTVPKLISVPGVHTVKIIAHGVNTVY